MKRVIKLPRSYERKNSFQDGIGLLWPCHMYAVNIKKSPSSSLNLFEKTILRICTVKPHRVDLLAKLLGIDIELVTFITSRLRERKLLQYKDGLLTPDQPFKKDSSENASEEVSVIYVFRELVGNHILPYTYQPSDSVEYRSTDESKEIVRVYFSSNRKQRYVRSITLNKTDEESAPPTVKNVLEALHLHAKIDSHYKSNLQGYTFRQHGGLFVNPSPELVYLFCDAYIDPATEEHTVTDGFGYKSSKYFSKCIQQLRQSQCDVYLNNKKQDWRTYLRKEWEIQQKSTKKHSPIKNCTNEIYKYQILQQHVKEAQYNLERIPISRPMDDKKISKYDEYLKEYYSELWACVEEVLRLEYMKLTEEDKVICSQLYIGRVNNKKEQALDIVREFGLVQTDIPNDSLLWRIHFRIQSLFRFDGSYSAQKSFATLLAKAKLDPQSFIHRLPQNICTTLAFLFQARNTSQHTTSIEPIRLYGRDLYHVYQGVYVFMFAAFPQLKPDGIDIQNLDSFDMDFYQENGQQKANLGKGIVESKLGHQLAYTLSKHDLSLYQQLVTIENRTKQSPVVTGQIYSLLQDILRKQQQNYIQAGVQIGKDAFDDLLYQVESSYLDVGNTRDRTFKRNLEQTVFTDRSYSLTTQMIAVLLFSYVQNPAERFLEEKDIKIIREVIRKRRHGHNAEDLPDISQTLTCTYSLIQRVYSAL